MIRIVWVLSVWRGLLLFHQDDKFNERANALRLIAMPDFILNDISILIFGKERWHLYWNFYVCLALGSQIPQVNVFGYAELVLTTWENEIGVFRPGRLSVVLDGELLFNLLVHLHLVLVWVRHTNQPHRGLHSATTLLIPLFPLLSLRP